MLGIETVAWGAREVEVGGVLFAVAGGDLIRELVGGGGGDEPDDVLEVPVGFHELDGEPVEELGVGGAGAHDAEILGGFDESAAEEIIPHAVDGDAGGEGVFLADQPLGELLTGRGGGGGAFGEEFGDGGGDFFLFESVFSALEDVGDGGCFLFLHDEAEGAPVFNGGLLGEEFFLLGCELLHTWVEVVDVILVEGVPLFFIEVRDGGGEDV